MGSRVQGSAAEPQCFLKREASPQPFKELHFGLMVTAAELSSPSDTLSKDNFAQGRGGEGMMVSFPSTVLNFKVAYP